MVELSVEGKKQVVDIGDLIVEACESIVPLVANAIKKIVATADPEYPTSIEKQHHIVRWRFSN